MTEPNAVKTPETVASARDQERAYEDFQMAVARLAAEIVANRVPPPPPSDRNVALRADYQVAVDMVKLLTDIRFRCLVFVTALAATANALIPITAADGMRAALGLVGLLATIGITVYDLRNSQLYESAIHRAKFLERSIGVERSAVEAPAPGLFNERPAYVLKDDWQGLTPEEWKEKAPRNQDLPLMRFMLTKIKHDRGLALIYGAALGGWMYLFVYGVLSLPKLVDSWTTRSIGEIRLGAGVAAGSFLILSVVRLWKHDEERFQPTAPDDEKAAAARKARLAKQVTSVARHDE